MNRRTITKRDKDKAHRTIVLFASPVAELRKRLIYGLQNFFTFQEATEWEKLEWAMANVKPSVLLLDLGLIPPEGIGSISAIQLLSPSTKIILLNNLYDEKEAMSALKSGVKGICPKDIEPSMLKKAIEVVQKGEVWACRKTVSRLLSEVVSLTESRQKDPPNLSEVCLDYLTPREFQIAQMVGSGANNKEIAHRLNITESTVKSHLTTIFSKLQIPDRLRLGLFIVGHHLDVSLPSTQKRLYQT